MTSEANKVQMAQGEQAAQTAQMKHTPCAASHTVICKAVPEYDQAAVDAAVEEIFAACPCTGALNADSKVLLKPNLIAKHPPEHAATTHPAVVRAAVRACLARGVAAQHITIADSSGGVYNAASMRGIYKAAGYTAIAQETGVQLYTACEAAPRTANGVLVPEFNLLMPVHTADFIINLPKLKTHVMAGLTCAVKNLFGTIPGLQKAELHMRFPEKDRFGDMLCDLCACVAPQLHIVDAVVGMEGDGPAGGTPRAVGAVLGGEDPYAIDLAAARIIGIDAKAVPYLAAGMRRGVCAERLEETWLTGDIAAAAPVKDYKLPESYGSLDFTDHVPRFLHGVARWGMGLVTPRPKVAPKKCIGCGKCAEICPGHTITLTDKKAHIDPKGCIRCFCCHEMCPVKAIDVKRFGMFDL